MTQFQRRIVTVLMAFLLLPACSGTAEKSDSENRKAAETNTALGRQYMDRGQYEISLEKLKRAVSFDKTYAPAHTMLGVLYETIGETESAEKEYRLAVQYDPTDGDVNNNLGAFLCGINKRKEADQYFLAAVEDPFYSTPEIALSNAGSCAMARGDLDKAEEYLRESLRIDARLAGSLLSMSEVSYRQGSFLRARAFLQRYEAVAPATRESLELGLRIETELGDQEAVEEYRKELRERFSSSVQAGGAAGQG